MVEDSKSLLHKRAFEAAPVVRLSADDRQKIYESNEIFERRGDVDSKSRSQFNMQFENLMNQFVKWGKANQCKTEGYKEFLKHVLEPDYYVKQSNEFYEQMKYQLEAIYLKLNDAAMDPAKCEAAFSSLEQQIDVCGPGVFTSIERTFQQLYSTNTIPYRLAAMRTDVIDQFARLHINKKNISKGCEIHVNNVLLQQAINHGWNPLGGESLEFMKEIHQNLAQVGPEDIIDFEKYFNTHYTSEKIVEQLALSFTQEIKDFVKKLSDDEWIPYSEQEDFIKKITDYTENFYIPVGEYLELTEDYKIFRILPEFYELLDTYILRSLHCPPLRGAHRYFQNLKPTVILPDNKTSIFIYELEDGFVSWAEPRSSPYKRKKLLAPHQTFKSFLENNWDSLSDKQITLIINQLPKPALVYCARDSYIELIKYILSSKQCNSDMLNARSKNGTTAFMYAAHDGQTDTVMDILQHRYFTKEAFDATNEDGNNAFLAAIQGGHKVTINTLLQSHMLVCAA